MPLNNKTKVNRLQDEDPDYLEQLEREALLEDPEIFAEMITQIISKDESLLKEITAKLSQDKVLMVDANELLEENESLEDRPEVLGILLAKYLSEDPSLLDEFDELFELDEGFDGMDGAGDRELNYDEVKDEL
jgi:hypothetical protein